MKKNPVFFCESKTPITWHTTSSMHGAIKVVAVTNRVRSKRSKIGIFVCLKNQGSSANTHDCTTNKHWTTSTTKSCFQWSRQTSDHSIMYKNRGWTRKENLHSDAELIAAEALNPQLKACFVALWRSQGLCSLIYTQMQRHSCYSLRSNLYFNRCHDEKQAMNLQRKMHYVQYSGRERLYNEWIGYCIARWLLNAMSKL